MKKIWYALFEESAARRPYWIFHGDELKEQTRKLILQFQKPTLDELCLKRFELDPYYKMIHPKLFLTDLKNEGLYDKIIDIMKEDTFINDNIKDHYAEEEYDFIMSIDINNYINSLKPEYIKHIVENDFKRIYSECTKETIKKINKLLSKLIFTYYFDEKQNEGLELYKDEVEKINELYDNYKVNELLKDKRIENIDEIVRFIFDNQKGNKLLFLYLNLSLNNIFKYFIINLI